MTSLLETTIEEENQKENEDGKPIAPGMSSSNSDKLAPGFENMLYDSSMTHLRLPGDMSFYNILNVLLKNRRVAIIIEDAHFCDELSWAELCLILNGKELDVSVLLTMRSNNIKASAAAHGSFASAPSVPGSFSVQQSNADLSHNSFSIANQNNNTNNTNNSNNSASNPGINAGNSTESINNNNTSNTNNNSNNNSNTPNNNIRDRADRERLEREKERERDNSTATTRHRNSVLVNAISSSISVSRNVSIDVTAGTPRPYGLNQTSSPHLNNRSPTHEGEVQASRYGLKSASPALVSILSHERSTVIEMTGLGEPEVREVLLHTLKVDHVSQDLVRIVFDVSSGNAYWCKAIANFIKERGVKELEDAIQKGDSPHNALKVLILLRMEKLDVDQQLVLKDAAIIGDEFSERMLKHVLPARIQASLDESVDLLAEHGFIFCVEEYPEAIYAFQNELIRETLYELMPPR